MAAGDLVKGRFADCLFDLGERQRLALVKHGFIYAAFYKGIHSRAHVVKRSHPAPFHHFPAVNAAAAQQRIQGVGLNGFHPAFDLFGTGENFAHFVIRQQRRQDAAEILHQLVGCSGAAGCRRFAEAAPFARMESSFASGSPLRNGLDAFAPCKKLSQSEGIFPDGVKPGLHDVKHHGFNRIKEGITVIRAKRVKFKLGVVLGGYRNALAVFEIDNVQLLAADQDAVGCSKAARRPFGVVYSLLRRDERFIGEFHSDLGDMVDVGVRVLLHLVRPERIGFDDLQS